MSNHAVDKEREKSKAKYRGNDKHNYYCNACNQVTNHYVFVNPIPGIGTSFNCFECDSIPTVGSVITAYNMRKPSLC